MVLRGGNEMGWGWGVRKGDLVWGEALFLIFLKSRLEKNLMIPLAVDVILTCPLVAFYFSVHIILVVCMLVILCLLLLSSRSILQLGT